MGISKHTKAALRRRGKDILKSKVGFLKRPNTSMFHRKSKSKLFAPTIVLPSKLQPLRVMTQNTSVVHTSKSKKSTTSPKMASAFKRFSAPLPPASPSEHSNRSTRSLASLSSVKSKLKKMKKSLGIKKKKKSASMGVQVNSPWVPKDVDEDDEDKRPPFFLVLNRSTSSSFETADISNPNTPMSQATADRLKLSVDDASTTSGLPVISPSESFAGASFVDTDDETNDGNNTLHSGDKAKMKCSEEDIQSKLELELNRLDAKLKTKKAERLSIAKEQLNIAVSEERSQNMKAPMKQRTLLSLVTQILPIAFIVQWILSSIFFAPYCHDTAMEQSLAFFGKKSGMHGRTVVVSETTSKLGSTIEDRFTKLGATVESLQDNIDCSNLESVASSVDAFLKNHGTIDFMVQTGTLCQSRNYLSKFMATEKILPSLEKSRYGTLVLFGSETSNLVPEFILPGMVEEESQNKLASLFYLPLQFPSNKMFEKIQHRIIARDYPNIRTFEVSNGWLGIGDKAADDFFGRVFLEQAGTSTMSYDDEDLYEAIYEGSVNAVWKWLVPPTTMPPVSQMVLGRPPSQQIAVRAQQKSPEASVTSYFPVNTATVVTTGALAVLAMHTKSFSWWSGSD